MQQCCPLAKPVFERPTALLKAIDSRSCLLPYTDMLAARYVIRTLLFLTIFHANGVSKIDVV